MEKKIKSTPLTRVLDYTKEQIEKFQIGTGYAILLPAKEEVKLNHTVFKAIKQALCVSHRLPTDVFASREELVLRYILLPDIIEHSKAVFSIKAETTGYVYLTPRPLWMEFEHKLKVTLAHGLTGKDRDVLKQIVGGGIQLNSIQLNADWKNLTLTLMASKLFPLEKCIATIDKFM
jgi:hypothetical protein